MMRKDYENYEKAKIEIEGSVQQTDSLIQGDKQQKKFFEYLIAFNLTINIYIYFEL